MENFKIVLSDEEKAEMNAYLDKSYGTHRCGDCDNCHMNQDIDHESGHPCGQYRCWIGVEKTKWERN